MDENTEATATSDDAPVEDLTVEEPSLSDMDDKRLTKRAADLAKKWDAVQKKPVTDESYAEAAQIREQQTAVKAEAQARFEAREKLKADMATLGQADVALPSLEDAPATIGDAAGDDEGAAVDEKPEQLIAASATAPTVAALANARGTQPTGAATATDAPAHKPMAWVAAAGAQNVSTPGMELSMKDLTEALGQFWHSKTPLGSRGIVLASIPALPVQESDKLGKHNVAETNTRMMREAVDHFRARKAGAGVDAKMAAICDPLDIIREIKDLGRSLATPFSDSLPFRAAGRLGFQYIRALSLSSVTTGVRLWSDTDQDGVTDEDDTWKPVVDVTCGTAIETRAEELTWGLRYEESTDISSPERVADFLRALMAQEKRRREGYLLRRFDQLSSTMDWATPALGGIPDVVEIIGRLLELAAYNERLEKSAATVWLPPGFLTALSLDNVSKAFNPDRANDALAEIKAALPEGITVVELRDISDNADLDPDRNVATTIANESALGGEANTFGAVGGGTVGHLVHDQCRAFRIRIGWPESFLAYSTGEVDFGVMRSPELIRQNKTIQFGREWLGLSKHGAENSALVDMTLMVAGVRMGYRSGVGVDCSS